MATQDRGQVFTEDFERVTFEESTLPVFPGQRKICRALPHLKEWNIELTQADFLFWVDFTLEQPDEIWETEGSDESLVFYYLMFLDVDGRPPVFAVEVCGADDSIRVVGFSLVSDVRDLVWLRSGRRLSSRLVDLQQEVVIQNLNERALSRYDEDCLEEARELIDLAIKISGAGNGYLLNNRGLICWKMGMVDEAKGNFLQSIRLDHGNGDPFFNIGLIYFDEADYGRALYYLRKAVALNPRDSQFLAELGHLYLELDREDEAMEHFTKALEFDPNDAQVHFHLGYYFLYKKRKPRIAVRYYGLGLQQAPEDQFALVDLAIAHLALGNRRKVQEIYCMLQKNSHLVPYAMSRLVYLNLELGDYESALMYYREALACDHPFEPEWLHYNAALVYAKTGRSRLALDLLNLAVRAGGEVVLSRAMSDKTLQELKRIPDFKKLLKLPSKRRNR